jgi:hypothetical protein
MLSSQAKRWCFTLNNWTHEERLNLHLLGESISADGDQSFLSYLIFGVEIGESGTPHLQGYCILREKARLSRLKEEPGLSRAHLEIARGTHESASTYCKKDGDFHEYGEPPKQPGARGHWKQLQQWLIDLPSRPTIKDVCDEFPALVANNENAVNKFIEMYTSPDHLVQGPFIHPWQIRVNGIVDGEPDDRKVIFVVDPEGNKGKSWLTRYWLTHRGGTQFLSVGKRDDLAYAVKQGPDLFVFDIPRGNMQFLQYSVLEQLKNRVIFSTKYQSQTKILPSNVHVVVFSNEAPDMESLTNDRYKIINI